MSHYAEQIAADQNYQKILQILSLWRVDCGFTPTASQTDSAFSITSVIQNALDALSCLYTIPKVVLSGFNVEHFSQGRSLSTCNHRETSLRWCFNPNVKQIHKIQTQLLSLKTSCQLLESGKLLTLFPYLEPRQILRKSTSCQSMIQSHCGLTQTKLVKAEVKLYANLLDFLQTLETYVQSMTPKLTADSK